MKRKYIFLSIILWGWGLAATAQEADTDAQNPHTTVGQERVLPRLTTKIQLRTRAYGDSIVLRWAAEDFVSYNYLARLGVNILRVPRGAVGDTLHVPDLRIDTLAYELKPLTLEQFRRKYAPNDSNALVAMGLLYSEKQENAHKEEGFMSDTQNKSSDQDITYGLSMLVADWRKDLATDMAVRFTDRTAQPGQKYDYYVQPTVWENNGRLIFEPGFAEDVANVPYQPETFQPRMTDSLSTPYKVTLGWWDGLHSSFEVERRQMLTLTGKAVRDNWQRITEKPYVPMITQPEGEDYCVIVDSVPQLGLWAYRIMGYDPFGDLTEPAEHEIFVRDVEPPLPPVLKTIVIERPDDNDPMSKVIAHVIWQKDTLEEDLAGYRIYYRPMRDNGNPWQAMNFNLLAPTDTMLSLDMTGRRTGMMYIAAYDQTGNESKSFMQQIRLTDFKAPAIPENLRAEVRPIDIEADSMVLKTNWAYIDLYWQPHPEDDDIDYFDIAWANDTTHTFLLRNEGGIRQSAFTDSVALNVNQKYIYYKVRAIDESTNVGEWSQWIQVERPHITPPTQPHLKESAHNDETGMHMVWVVGTDADMKEHLLYRRLGTEGDEEVIGRYDADSVKLQRNIIVVDDNPPYAGNERYYYWLASTNASPFISRSMAVSWRHQGPRIITLDIQLESNYDAADRAVILGWNTGEGVLPEGDWYWAIFRRGPEESHFNYYTSAKKEDRTYIDHTLQPGEQAEYYLRLQFSDSRRSPDSNTVVVTAPK